MNPRKPTEAEKNELVTYLLVNDYANDKDEREQVEGFVKSAAIAVFDDYISGGPGYAGKIMVVIYDGGPYQTETYTWIRDINPGEENVPIGQINWQDGNHEPKLHRDVEIQQ